jgi:hypothetical protein
MKSPRKSLILLAFLLALALTVLTGSARANVYATNIKVNGSTNSPTVSPGNNVSLSYILNEPASAGITVQIVSGATVVRSIAVSAGNQGTLRGTNLVTWDGRNNAGNPVAGGDYSVRITAAATGQAVWFKTSDDTNSGNQVWSPWGIAVNQNTNSSYYGRVFVGNSATHAADPVDPLGFHKLNADGSPAEEGMLSDGGYSWTEGYFESPFRVRVGPDDRFYALDWFGNGAVMSWDQQITTNSLLYVLADNNIPASGSLSGFAVTDNGTNRQLWMTDFITSNSGLIRWDIQADGTIAPGDQGTQIIQVGNGSDLDDSAFDVGLDRSNRIYLVCLPNFDSQYKVMRFPAYSGTLLTTADWKVDNTTPFDNNFAIAVNPAGSYAAVSLNESNALLILDANTGSTVTNIPVAGPAHAVAWDNAGNAYIAFDGNGTTGLWQTWSPPGANQATTTALETIHVVGLPQITSIARSGNDVTIHFTGPTSDPASAYVLLSGSAVAGITNNAGATITGGGGTYQATLSSTASPQYYRVQRP